MKKTFTYLIATAALMIVSAAAMAQGGLAPFLNSTHTYKVTMEDGTNISNPASGWVITDASGTPLSPQPTFNASTDVDTAFLEITWDESWASAGTNYKVQFTEDDGTCSTVKEVSVTVGTNSFDVSTSDPDATCNAADGQLNYSGSNATTPITFKVDMTTSNSGFSPNWEIAFSLTPGSGASISNVAASGGSLSGTGPYTLTDLTSSTGTGTVNITMDVTGDINTVLDVVLAITSATELTYNTPDVDSDDWTATQTINAIPATSDITTD